MIYILIAIALYFFVKQGNGVVNVKAGLSLNTVGSSPAGSSSPVPDSITPPFYQTDNLSTGNQPITSESFTPNDTADNLDSNTGIIASPVAKPLVNNTIHNNHIVARNINNGWANLKLRSINAATEYPDNSSIADERYGTEQNIPEVTSLETNPRLGYTLPTKPATFMPKSTIIAPVTEGISNPTFEKIIPTIASNVTKAALTTPTRTTSRPNTLFFRPIVGLNRSL
jgi:hypothetical protein